MPTATLHPILPTDAPTLIAANLSNRAFHAPFAHPFTDQPGFDTWFATIQRPTATAFLIRDAETAALTGVINLTQITHGNFCSAYLGFYAYAPHAGRGLMTSALTLACDHAFTSLALHRLEANIQPANHRSIALAKRCGFQKEGFSPAYLRIDGAWRDHERWALLSALGD